MQFTHLHTHSHYSLLDGLPKIDDLIRGAKELGMTSLALTDHGNLYGALEFYQKAKKAGIKPILGCELYCAFEKHTDKRAGIDNKRYHLTVLAKNYEGYRNLIQLVTLAHTEGYYYKPRVDKDLLRRYSAGLIGLSGCISSEISQAILARRLDAAEKLIREYQEIFGKENFYVELGSHAAIPEQKVVNDALLELSSKTGAPIVGTNDIHYVKKEDREAQDILVSVQTGATVNDTERMTMKNEDFSMKSAEEMLRFFAAHPEAVYNTQKIADAVDIQIPLGRILLPTFQLPAEEKSLEEYLRKLCEAGLMYRYGKISLEKEKIIRERLDYELSVINKMGFASYFLIVHDFVNWAKNKKIVVGPGRGSAAGSLVSYLLNITNLDPLEYNLLFERFLNPSRISMPDIDLDFADTRRDEVLRYVAEKYGYDHFAQIITFGTMAARAAIRDTGRALGYPYSFCDQLAKLIPFNPTQGMKEGWLDDCLRNVPDFKNAYEQHEDVKRLIDSARKLEGVVRHASTHACGVVIGPEPLYNYLPIQYSPRHNESKNPMTGQKEIYVTQYEMHAVEELGLLKMDFLGLKNLSIIEDALRRIKETDGTTIDIDHIPLDDRAAYKTFQDAKTTGVFQFESSGMKRNLKDLKSTELEDLIAMVALYRPGPMDLIPSYIARKHGQEAVSYIHPKLEPALKNTYGIGVYQEQMMQIARDLAGYTLAEADTLRKAIGKKIKSLLNEQHEKLVAGMIKNGIDAKTAEEIWELFPPFARYGFNRCLTGDTKIYNQTTGALTPIKNIYNEKIKNFLVTSLSEDTFKFALKPAIESFFNGKKRVWQIITNSGRHIKATANHPFLTAAGWDILENLKVREKIAVARKISEPASPLRVEKHKLGLLGYLLAEGNLCHPHGFYFYSKSEEEIMDYLNYLEKFKNTIGKVDKSKSAIAVYSKRKNVRTPSEAVEWINSLGLKYKKAIEKFFPDFIFNLSNDCLAFLIAKMFQGDGCINNKRKGAQIFYATSSQKIARGFQHLLLRFGILSTIHQKKFKYRSRIRTGYTITVSRYDNIKKFIDTFSPYFVGQKKETSSTITQEHPIINKTLEPWAARGSFDVIPAECVLEKMRYAVTAGGFGFKEFERKHGVSWRLFMNDKRKIGYLRETIGKIADAAQNNELLKYAESDIYWDEIKSIEYAGIEDTYDLTVADTHNFVANDIIVHNSHAACYALVAYQTGYLKTHYPAEFMASLMTAELADIDRISLLVQEVKEMGIEVLPPDINESFETFTVIHDPNLQMISELSESKTENYSKHSDVKSKPFGSPAKIRFGLSAIKNVGENIVKIIIEERTLNGKFTDVGNFVERIAHKDLNKKSLEALMKCGAMDAFENRNTLIQNLDTILEYARDYQRQKSQGQVSLFTASPEAHAASITLTKHPPRELREVLLWEKELLGLYVSAHPLQEYRARFPHVTSELSSLMQNANGKFVTISGLLGEPKKIFTKRGEPMLFVPVEDMTGRAEILVFPKILAHTDTVWQEGAIAVIKGTVSDKDGAVKILCEEAVKVA